MKISVVASELFDMVHVFVISSIVKLGLSDMIDQVVVINLHKYSRSLYDCLRRINWKTERLLIIEFYMIR